MSVELCSEEAGVYEGGAMCIHTVLAQSYNDVDCKYLSSSVICNSRDGSRKGFTSPFRELQSVQVRSLRQLRKASQRLLR